MRILIIGEKYSSNLGDGVICDNVVFLVKNIYPHAEIIMADLSGREDYEVVQETKNSFKTRNSRSIKRYVARLLSYIGVDVDYIKFKRYFQHYKSYVTKVCKSSFDIAVFAGGQLFKDTFVFPIKAFVDKLEETNTPIVFNAVGVGPINSKKMRSILRDSLLKKHVLKISTRDDIDWIKDLLGQDKEVMRTNDPAIWSSQVYPVKGFGGSKVGLGIMYVNNMPQKDLIRFWIKIIKELDENKIEWAMFCNGSVNDYLFARDLLNKLGFNNVDIDKKLVKRPRRPEELVNIISSFKSIISFRLHSHIIAYSLNIPGIALVWDPKVYHFFKNLKLECRCKTIYDDSKEIIDTLIRVENDKYNQDQKKTNQLQCIENLTRMCEDCMRTYSRGLAE